ncbi:MAG: NADH-quinone oxidoreductase subunit C [Elusimicrobia bacterium]|nr:NADH-quinone oxidoreductase subunit C [Candidatus Liberimonas magnetica]
MSKEQDIQKQFMNKFDFLEGKFKIVKNKRIFLDVPIDKFWKVMGYAVKIDQFPLLCTITGLDQGDTIGLVYHLAANDGMMLNIETSIPKNNPVIRTITDIYPSATLYERELEDLLGVKVEGLPAGRRYPLPDDWPIGDHPLLKDWKPKN